MCFAAGLDQHRFPNVANARTLAAILMTISPKYSEIELFNILQEETSIPISISEHCYETQLKNNSALKWRVNGFLFKPKLRNQLLAEDAKKKINLINYLNWVVVISIVIFSIFTNHYMDLWILLLYPFFMPSGLTDYWIVITNSAILLTLSFKFDFHTHYFILLVCVFISAFLISKMQFSIFKKAVFRNAFSDFKLFWKYYSYKLIYVDKTAIKKNYKELFERYPDLNI